MRDPHDRQILASLGNRYVVFGSGLNLPDRRQFGPEDVKRIFPRVADERDEIEQRIAESLVVEGFDVRRKSASGFGDIEIVDSDGRFALVEIKVGDRDFAGLNLGQVWADLSEALRDGERREIWAFNIERLGLGVVWSDGPYAPRFEQLPALNVWELNEDNTIFKRQDVVDRLNDWSHRIETIYRDVEEWARGNGITTTRDRTVPMSEELMQKFAVPDRELPILDLAVGATPIASMVPVGLWLIGFNGQINIITRDETFKLGDRATSSTASDWVLIDPRQRSVTPWKREELASLLKTVVVHE